MKTINQLAVARRCRPFIAGLVVLALGACSLLRPTATPAPTLYSLDNAYSAAPLPALAAVSAQTTAATLTLIINPPQAAAGFDSQRIIYVREPHKLDYFAHSQWVDPPARMLGPLLLAAVERSGAFRAVVLTPGAAAGDLRLDTEIIRLQHEFQTQPSRVRFTLRATLVENKTRRVLAGREFEAVAPASSDDPYGGVVAANQAVQTVLENLAQFLTERKQ
jgi:cholesterol transport system auxiliary component